MQTRRRSFLGLHARDHSQATGRYRGAAGLVAALIVLMSAGTALADSFNNTAGFDNANGVPYSVTGLGWGAAEASNEFLGPSPGDYLVAVEFRVTDISAHYDVSGDADLDATVAGSDDLTYTASFDTVTECTNFDDGEIPTVPGGVLYRLCSLRAPGWHRASRLRTRPASAGPRWGRSTRPG
jgi:hypothetical protein